MWGTLPLLPLRCVLEHLSTEDAMTAMSVCRHWRSTILLYEGHKDTLVLRARQQERNMFLTKLFKKHVKRLHIYIDCNQREMKEFFTLVLPQFFDTLKLCELIFIGQSYVHSNSTVKLDRKIVESLVFKHFHSIHKFGLMDCEMGPFNENTKEGYQDKLVEYYSRSLSFNGIPTPADNVLSRSNTAMMVFSTLQHIIVSYEEINTSALKTLSQIAMFSQLTINVTNKSKLLVRSIQWHSLAAYYPKRLDVAVNIIGLSVRKFTYVIENILVEDLALTSLKVMFCKTIHMPLLKYVASVHKDTLRELVWTDSPSVSTDARSRLIELKDTPIFQVQTEICAVNPFIIICWRCHNLRRLVIHGYWVWHYDLLGMMRLRKNLRHLEVSAIYDESIIFFNSNNPDSLFRVLAHDTEAVLTGENLSQIREYMDSDWSPIPWGGLHPGLKLQSTRAQQADYVLQEARQALGVT